MYSHRVVYHVLYLKIMLQGCRSRFFPCHCFPFDFRGAHNDSRTFPLFDGTHRRVQL